MKVEMGNEDLFAKKPLYPINTLMPVYERFVEEQRKIGKYAPSAKELFYYLIKQSEDDQPKPRAKKGRTAFHHP